MIEARNTIKTPNGRCAYVHLTGKTPGVFFLGGFKSNMQGLKALAVEKYCRHNGITFTRFDYSGHGQSSGEFVEGTISHWLEDALTIFNTLDLRQQIIVGSSMGAWIGTHLCLSRQEQTIGMLGLASALDFTRTLASQHLNATQTIELQRDGLTQIPSCHDNQEPYPITQRLIDDGEQYCLLDDPIPIDIPVRLVHGLQDRDIDWQTSLKFAEYLHSHEVDITLIKDGDHRLSSDPHLEIIIQTLDRLYQYCLKRGAAPRPIKNALARCRLP